MQYRNTRTGAVIETACVVSGEHWEEVKPQKGTRGGKPKAEEPAQEEQE